MKKITNISFICLIVIIIFTSTYGEGIHGLIKLSGVDCYLSIILSTILSLPTLYIFNCLFNYEPSLNIFEKNKKLFKHPLIPNTIIILFAFLVAIIQMFNLTNFLVSQFLTETDPLIIGIIFTILLIYLCTKDTSTLCKISSIILPINLLLFIIALIGILPQFKIDNLLPFLEHGLKNPILGSIYIFLINICPIFFILLIPKDKVTNFKTKNIYIAYTIYFILSIITTIFTIGTLGINLSKLYQYPEYILLRRFNFFDFLTRMENILFLQWIFGLFIFIGLCTITIKEQLKFKYNHIIISILILFVSLKGFKTLTLFNEFTYYIYPYISLIFLLFIIIIFIKTKKLSKN